MSNTVAAETDPCSLATGHRTAHRRAPPPRTAARAGLRFGPYRLRTAARAGLRFGPHRPDSAWKGQPVQPGAPRTISPSGQNRPVDLARIGWIVTVLACLIAVLILLLQAYYGYALVTFAVAVSAAFNLT